VPDDDYRDALQMIANCRSSKSPAFTDRHLDKLLAYFEAIHWRGVDAGTLQPSGSATAVFRRRGYWAGKNPAAETSRDRFNGCSQAGDIAALEAELARLGFGAAYCAAIRENACNGRSDAHALHLYQAALARTLKSKARCADRADRADCPF